MPLTTTGRDKLLDSGKAAFTYIGALTDLSGTEVAGGSYARQAITWAAAGSGAAGQSGTLTIPIPAGTTVVALASFDASSAGNRLSLDPYGSSGQAVKGVATVTTADLFTCYSHGLTTDDRVFVATVGGASLPSGLSATTLYYVLASGLTTDAFKLSTSSGGSAVDVAADGEVAFFKTVPNTFASAGSLSISAGLYTLDATFG